MRFFRLSIVFAILNFLFWTVIIYFHDGIDLPEIKVVCWVALAFVVSILILIVGMLGQKLHVRYSQEKRIVAILVYLAAILGIVLSIWCFYVYGSELLEGVYISPNDLRLTTGDSLRRLELRRLVFDQEDILVFAGLLFPAFILPLIVSAVLWALNPKKKEK